MAGLLDSNTYTFSELCSKHNGFLHPSAKIKVGGVDISTLDLGFDSLEIKQTIKDSSGSCKFTIKNGYDSKARKFKDIIKNTFPLGKDVEASLGYSNPKLLFKGFVADVSFSFEGGNAPSVTIMCVDIRALMKQGQLNAMLQISSFPIIAMEILTRYTSLVKMEIIYIDIWNILEDFQQNTNDFNYIYNYAKKRGYEFFVLGDNVYFNLKWLNTVPITTLEWGESIISYNKNFSSAAPDIRGAIAGILSLLPFSLSSPLSGSYPSISSNTSIVADLDTSDTKNPFDLASVIANSAIKTITDSSTGSVTCIGIPEIMPARFIKLKNLDSNFIDGKYYIEEVTHSFSGSGYTTSFETTSQI